MHAPNTLNWIRAGLLTLPVYGVLTIWATLDPQPNFSEHPEAWSRFVTADKYLITHLFGSSLSLIFAIFGTFALLADAALGRVVDSDKRGVDSLERPTWTFRPGGGGPIPTEGAMTPT